MLRFLSIDEEGTMRTALYDKHVALGAKITEFSGWEMPLQYKGMIHEHHVVRKAVGIFDVSHMGRLLVEGPDAESYLDFLATNVIAAKKDSIAIYTVFANKNGGCIDDAIIYRYNANKFAIIVNACNRSKDLQHFKEASSGFDVKLTNCYDEDGILAIQGPKAANVVGAVFHEVFNLRPMCFFELRFQDSDIVIARTGYTGSDGFEVSGPKDKIVVLWDKFLSIGKEYAIEPIGLGARDTLRLEAGYALYGHELGDLISPSESISAWTVKMNKKTFLGKEAMEQLAKNSKLRSQYGTVLLDRGIAREGNLVFHKDTQIGTVTSGSYAPTLDKAIAITMVNESLSEGDIIEIQVRNKRLKAEVVTLPFYKRRK